LTESEWNQSHPEQCQQYLETWKNKEQRENARTAAMQHITAVAGGVKIKGRAPKFEDFMQIEKTKKVNPVLSEARLKTAFMALAAQAKKE